ncbi:MAG: GNAT family N-acetyltransferase [Acidobacteria bacterium]|nr:GNAT family N-acetyltransferase [Acidobacteriota bacterium]
MDIRSYADYVADTMPVRWIGSLPWRVHRRILTPIAPPHLVGPVDLAAIRKVMRADGTLLARWTDAWDTAECQWWHICCDDPQYDLDRIPKSRRRNSVRKALRLCEVRLLSPDEFMAKGYDVYRAAVAHYTGPAPVATRQQFEQGIAAAARYDAWQTWGAFVDGKLAAYVVCLVIGDAVLRSSSKSDPAMHRSRPNEATSFVLTRHYLRDEKVSYVSAGCRSISHDTNVQDFLLSMGYRRIYSPLRVVLGGMLSAVIKTGVGRWGRYVGLARLRPALMDKLAATDAAVRIAKACRSVSPARDEPSPAADSGGKPDAGEAER